MHAFAPGSPSTFFALASLPCQGEHVSVSWPAGLELGAFFEYAPHGMEGDVPAAWSFVSGPLALGGLLTVHFASAKMVLCPSPSRKQVQKLAEVSRLCTIVSGSTHVLTKNSP